MSAKERLLLWTQQATEGYAGIRCENFTTCWRDGKLFNAIIHKYRYGVWFFPPLDKYEKGFFYFQIKKKKPFIIIEAIHMAES